MRQPDHSFRGILTDVCVCVCVCVCNCVSYRNMKKGGLSQVGSGTPQEKVNVIDFMFVNV